MEELWVYCCHISFCLLVACMALQACRVLNAHCIRCRDGLVTITFEGTRRSRLVQCFKVDGLDMIRCDMCMPLIKRMLKF